MSLTLRIVLGVLMLSMYATEGGAQLFTDQGLMSGSGLMIMPTPATAPTAEFGIQTARVEFLRPGERGMNVIGFTGGFSSHMEGYVRVSGEQVGLPSSVISYGFGAKLRSPFTVPAVEHIALWLESGSTEQVKQRAMYPPNVFRAGITASFGTDGINPTALVGLSSVEGAAGLLLGGGVTFAAGHEAQLGAEVVYGYTGTKSVHALVNSSLRVLPNISIHVVPGYVTSEVASTWLFSVGVSFTTTDIDYHPARVSNDDEFVVPSIEDIESQMQGEKKHE
jgi:hypothetical protein